MTKKISYKEKQKSGSLKMCEAINEQFDRICEKFEAHKGNHQIMIPHEWST